jgi:hypothetical protein
MASMLRARPARDETAAAVVDDVLFDVIARRIPAGGQVTTAVVDDISPDGVPRVIVSGDRQPREAASLVQFGSAAAASEALLGRTVLVLVSRSAEPVILGPVSQRLWNERDADAGCEAEVRLPAGGARSVQLDRRRLELEASEEIRLTCGKSSLLLRRDGTVIVRGVKIVSRASQSNKIRGATVDIN